MRYLPIVVLIAASSALAQSQDTLAPETQPSVAEKGGRRASGALRLTGFYENDSEHLKPNNSTDRHYTGGGALAFQWQSIEVNELVSAIPYFGNEFAPDTLGTSYSLGFVASLQVYTPDDLASHAPIYDDRPYASLAYGGLVIQRANRSADVPVFEHFELDLGTIGRASRGGTTQEWLHQNFSAQYPEGWDYQAKDDFGGDFKFLRRWRFDLASEGAMPTLQLIPEAGVTAGTMHINASAGATLRYGWYMPDDFGPSRVRYVGDFTRPLDRRTPGRLLGGYVFLRPGGRVVGHDSTIDGSYFRTSPVELNSQVFVAEIATGVAVQFLHYFEVAYYQTYTSPEFMHSTMWDSYATLMVNAVFTW